MPLNKDGGQERQPRYRPLAAWERAGAIAAGAAVEVAGFVSMFLTKNEGGVAIAILLGGVLLLLGIQGTPLTKLGFKDYSVEVARREEERKEAAQIIEEQAQEDPKKALGMAEGYKLADPEARRSPSVARAEAYAYQQQIEQVLSALITNDAGIEVQAVQPRASDDGYEADLLMKLPDGGRIIAEVKHYGSRRVLPTSVVLQMVAQAKRFKARGALVVTDSHISHSGYKALSELSFPVEVVRWNGEIDNTKVFDAMRRLLKRAQDTPQGNDDE